jgi:hypothetical protein
MNHPYDKRVAVPMQRITPPLGLPGLSYPIDVIGRLAPGASAKPQTMSDSSLCSFCRIQQSSSTG